MRGAGRGHLELTGALLLDRCGRHGWVTTTPSRTVRSVRLPPAAGKMPAVSPGCPALDQHGAVAAARQGVEEGQRLPDPLSYGAVVWSSCPESAPADPCSHR